MKITNVNDYVDSVHEKFPELTKEEVKKILVYGWKQVIQYVSAGNDFSIITPKLFFFVGKIPNSALSVFKTYKKHLARKIAYMFRRTKSEWDGYYYFARSEKQYKDYLMQSKKKIKVFKDVFLYKLLDEVKIEYSNMPYIFRLKEDKTGWLRKYYPEIKTKNAELIIHREPMKFKDILTTQNKFKYIQ